MRWRKAPQRLSLKCDKFIRMIQKMQSQQQALAEVERLSHDYPDVPIEAIFKEDLLRQGMAWSHEALEIFCRHKPKAYFIFSFDMVTIAQMDQGENTKAPEEIRLVGGPFDFRPVVVSVRLNPASPYHCVAGPDQCRELGQ